MQGLFTMTKLMGILPLVHVPVAANISYDITYECIYVISIQYVVQR